MASSDVSNAFFVKSNQFSIEITDFVPADNTTAPVDKPMPIKSNLPNIKQIDFFKTFLQIYGLTVDVDDENKMVRAYTFNHINNLKLSAKDWSSKYQKDSGKQRFTIGSYAKQNYLKYKTDENEVDKENIYTQVAEGLARYIHEAGNDIFFATSPTSPKSRIKPSDSFQTRKNSYFVSSLNLKNINYDDISYITATDETLKEEYTMIELDFEACLYNSIADSNYAKINRYTWDSQEGKGEFNFDAPNKLLLYDTVNFNIDIKDNNNNNIGKKLLRCITPNANYRGSVKAEMLLIKYYHILQDKILKDMRIIEDAEFYLTPKDIEEFDPFTPIYIDTFGAYFYINKIKNFIVKRLTKVDLVKI
jgi:hypothetical protein